MPLQHEGRGRASPDRLHLVMCYMDLSKFLHRFIKVVTWFGSAFLCIALAALGEREGFPRQATLVMCYMADLSKLLHGFVKVVTKIC